MDTGTLENLHQEILEAWNRQDAQGMADLFAEDGSVVGFDGSQYDGRPRIAEELGKIFADHQPASFIRKVREVRALGPDTALLRAVVGMLPPGSGEVLAKNNAIQSLVAVRKGDRWEAALFQNTPAQWHGRPEEAEALTRELQAVADQLPLAVR